jgi:hypothetical protein
MEGAKDVFVEARGGGVGPLAFGFGMRWGGYHGPMWGGYHGPMLKCSSNVSK